MDGRQRNMTATGREDDDYNHHHQQQRQQRQRQEERQEVEVEEERGSLDTLRDQPIRIHTQLLHSNSTSPPRQQRRRQEDYSGDEAMGGGGSGGVLLSAKSDMSDQTVFDWQAQDHHRHYYPPPIPSSFPGEDDRHPTLGIEVRHGKDKDEDKWMQSPPLPLPLFAHSNQEPNHQQYQYSTTPYQQQPQRQSWSSTIAIPSKNWARQTRIWFRQHLGISTETTSTHHHHHHNQHSPFFASNDPSLASASSSTSTSTILGDGGFYSRHHPYFQGRPHSVLTPSTSSSATFLSPKELESSRQYKKEEVRYFWGSPLTPRWSSTSFPFPLRILRGWGVFGRDRNSTNFATPTPSTTSAYLRLFTRRRRRTLHKWAWLASLMLVLTLAIYIVIAGVSMIHGYLASSGGGDAGVAATGRNRDLVSKGRDVWRKVGMGRIGAIKNVGHGDGLGGVCVESGVSGKTVTTEQDGCVPGPISSPGAAVSRPIWTQRAEDEKDDPLDFFPDEDEDDPPEAASFIAWLSQASLIAPTIQQQKSPQQHLPPQQYQEYHEPPRSSPPPPPRQQQQGEAGQASFLLEPERYFTYMPFAGISNQFYGMLRAMSIARALDRTLVLPPITSSSHDKSRQNQAWSEFFDLNEFRRRTGLKVVEYQDLRDRGSFRGPTGVRKSGSSVGASWIPPWVKEAKTTSAEKRGSERDQHSLWTGTSTVDMTMPCHVTCGFGSKRDLDFTAKAFVRQWGFQYKKKMLPSSSPPASPTTPPGFLPIDNAPIDQTRDFDRIVQVLQDDSLKGEEFLCISNTYKIQMSPTTIPASLLVDSIEWLEFGQHLLFQPRLTHFVDEFLATVLGERPEERAKYGNDTFWIPPAPSPPPEPLLAPSQVPTQPQIDFTQLQPPSQPLAMDIDNTAIPSTPQPDLPTDSRVSVPYASTVDLTPWPPLRPLIQHTFFMIHVRRGDFEAYCKKDFKDSRFDQCLPSNEAYANIINELQQRALRDSGGDGDNVGIGDSYGVGGIDGKNNGREHDRILVDEGSIERKSSRSKRRRIPVLVATNENRPEQLAQLRQLGRTRKATRSAGVNIDKAEDDAVAVGSGVDHHTAGKKDKEGGVVEGEEKEEEEWIILDHEEMKTVERLGVFGPMMVEQLLMAEAEALVGVRMSTFSRVGGYRQRDWYQRRILYM